MMQTNRRDFLRGSTIAAASLALGGCSSLVNDSRYPAVTRVAPKFRKPGEKLNIGVIGVGGKGWSDWMPMFQNGENIVALCDVDRGPVDRALAEIEKSGKKASEVKCYSDYRKMLDECKNLDAVTVSTPDHTHAPAAIRAMKQGCNVYVQKPLVRTIWEARYFEKVAKTCGVVTQMGNQGSAGDGHRRNVELLHAGILGNGHHDQSEQSQRQRHPQADLGGQHEAGDGRQFGGSGQQRQGEHHHQHGRFGQRGDHHLATGTDTAETGADIEAGQRQKKAGGAEQGDDSDQIRRPTEQQAAGEGRHQRRRHPQRGENQIRRHPKQPGGGIGQHHFLAQQLG